MSRESTQAMNRVVRSLILLTHLYFNTCQAKVLTDKDGWPKIFEEAIIAKWNTPPLPPSRPMVAEKSMTQVPQQIAASVVQNLTYLTSTLQSKFVGNIIQNIQLAAAYLSLITIVSWTPSNHSLIPMVSSHRARLIFPWTRTFPPNWMLVWRVQGRSFVTSLWPHLTSLLRAHPGGIFSDILHTLGLSLAEFQAPLLCSLAISPIILFRTCQLQSSRFGWHYYISVSKFPSSTFELCSPADLVFDQPGWYKAAFPMWDRIVDL